MVFLVGAAGGGWLATRRAYCPGGSAARCRRGRRSWSVRHASRAAGRRRPARCRTASCGRSPSPGPRPAGRSTPAGRGGTSARSRSSRRRRADRRRRRGPPRSPGPTGFSVPSTKPSRSRTSKYLKPCTSSRTVTDPRRRSMIWPASSKHGYSRPARIWNSRSPGVDTARCRGPISSRNGCSSAGRGPPNSRSQAVEPMPATQLSLSSGTRNPTARCSAGRLESRSRATGSPPGSIVTTRKIAEEDYPPSVGGG